MGFQHINYRQEDRTAVLTITREKQMNALGSQTISELLQAAKQAEADAGIRGLILTGSGEKAFVAGADIKEFVHKTPQEAQRLSQAGHELMDALERLGKPVLAAINGFALGGGLELALSCHMRIAVSEAKLGLPETSLGLIPGYGGTQRLPQLIGKGRALAMMLSAEMIDAQEALSWGLVHQVVDRSALMDAAMALLEKMYSQSPQAIAAAIAAVNAGQDARQDGYTVEIERFKDCFGSSDFQEGVAAFLDKRKPNF